MPGEVPAPPYRRLRREALIAALLWVAAVVWTVGVSFLLGAERPTPTVGGLPKWMLWGVLAPWVVFFLAHAWLTLVYMRESDRQS